MTGISGIGIQTRIGIGGSGSQWNPQRIASKFLYGGKVSEISGGQMPNKINGTSDYLTVAGSAGSYTFQAPNTADYQNADTDYIWFMVDTGQRTTTTAELIGYDFAKTFVKYLSASPYTLEEIWILKDGESLTQAEEDKMRDYCNLSLWWSGVLSSHGELKGNRGPAQSTWTAESITPYNLVLTPISDTVMQLDWDCDSVLLDGYKIEQSADGVTYNQVDTSVEKTKQIESLTENTNYYYRLRGYKGAIDTDYCTAANSWTAHAFTLTKTGTGAGVATIRIRFTADTVLTLDGVGKFYSDSGGTADESSTWTVVAGAIRTRYIRVSTGTSKLLMFHKNTLYSLGESGNTGWSGNGSVTNAPSLTIGADNLSRCTALRNLNLNSSVLGTINITNLTVISYCNVQSVQYLTGVITGLTSLIYFYTSATGVTITGDVRYVVASITYFRVMASQLVTYTSGATWGNATITINPSAGYGYDSTEIDNMLIDMAASTALISKTITLQGANAARTAASDAAVATLTGAGRTNTLVLN